MFKYVHHIHYLVNSRDSMVEYLEKNFGMKPDHMGINAKVQLKEALYNIGETQMQITEPLDPTSIIGRHLEKHGPGVYHVAWGVNNIQKLAQELVAKGNKVRGNNGIQDGPRGHFVSNIDPASSHGLWFQLAEGAASIGEKAV